MANSHLVWTYIKVVKGGSSYWYEMDEDRCLIKGGLKSRQSAIYKYAFMLFYIKDDHIQYNV